MTQDQWIELGTSLLAHGILLAVLIWLFMPEASPHPPLTVELVGREHIRINDAGFLDASRDTFTISIKEVR